MEEKIKALEDKIDLLEWKLEILQKHIKLEGISDILIKLNITRGQFSQIHSVIRKYAGGYKEIWDNSKKRHDFEKEFAEINGAFKTNKQAVAEILKEITKEVNCPNYKLLFVRLYGRMTEYEGIFSEIGYR